MIKPELAFAIILTSNFAAPILALVAGRTWPRMVEEHYEKLKAAHGRLVAATLL
ncbi:hypothetical protein ACVMIX_004333 [Rhizobium leguminosarum]